MAEIRNIGTARYGYRLHGTVAGERYTAYLRDGLHRLGRDPDNDLVVGCDGVSRRHCLLLVGPDGLEVVDQGSTNGTFVDGTRVDRARVRTGALLRLDHVELKVETLESEDDRLGLELVPAEALAAGSGNEPTAPPMSTVGISHRWLGLVDRFATSLVADGSGLESLLSREDGLGAEAAVIVRLAGDREPEVLAACGIVPEEHIRAVAEVVTSSDVPEEPGCIEGTAFRFHGDGGGGGRALIVSGDFPGREHCGPLLGVLLRIHGAVRGAPPVREESAPGELDFPAGFVAGTSPVMSRLYDRTRSAAGSRLPVLIVGETGVGKELMARLVHGSSPRRRAPLVTVNCAAIPRELLEAELFGIGDRVATGVAGRPGKFHEADGGSLFLDEVGDMPAELQAKLLRVLQEGRVEPLGRQPRPVDVRILAATNSDLEQRIADGRFRRDLYYRLAGFVLEVPPLRRRAEDLPALIEHLLRRASREIGKPIRGLTIGALQRLCVYRWPGNVRELEHLMRRLVHLCPAGQAIDSGWLAEAGFTGEDGAGALTSAVSALDDLDLGRLERTAIREALRRSGGNLTEAASHLGLTRFSLRRRLERHDLVAGDG